jgi:hypothetical protein
MKVCDLFTPRADGDRRAILRRDQTDRSEIASPWAAVLLLAATCLSACVPILAIPQDHAVGRAVTANPVTIRTGVTTAEDVRRQLGEPNAILPREHVFVYHWKHVTMEIFLVAAAGPFSRIGAADIANTEVLLIQFDKDDLVSRVEHAELPRSEKIVEFLQNWAKGQ